MSYSVTVSEEIRIRAVDKATSFLAKSLGYYIDNFFTAYRINRLDISKAVLTVDGQTAVLKNVHSEGCRDTHRETAGRKKGKKSALTSKPSGCCDFRNFAKESLPFAKEVFFSISYDAECAYGADIGINNMITALEAMNNPIVRQNVEYKSFQETHPGESFEIYRFDAEYQGYDPLCDSRESIGSVREWEFDGYTGIGRGKAGTDPFRSPAAVRKIIRKIRPIYEKYGLEIDRFNDGDEEITTSGCAYIPADRLDEFFADLQTLINICRSNNLEMWWYTGLLISRETGKPAMIGFSVDDSGTLQKTYKIA